MASGTYVLIVGDRFYVGSSGNLSSRKSSHRCLLRDGLHPNTTLQMAFSQGGEFNFVSKKFIDQKLGETKGSFRDRLWAEEQKLLDELKGDPGICNLSMCSRGPDSNAIYRYWARRSGGSKSQAAFNRKLAGTDKPSQAARGRMAIAKQGVRNPRATAVVVTNPSGETTKFATVTAAAEYFKVSQQLMESWIKGRVPWPGTGKFVRKANAWIAPYRAVLETCDI